MSVSAGKLQQWVQVTHEVIDEIGATEGQLESEDNLYHVMNKAPVQATTIRKAQSLWFMIE